VLEAKVVGVSDFNYNDVFLTHSVTERSIPDWGRCTFKACNHMTNET
jgi:hypothetical protein